jgi:hypothetical protein
VQVGLIHLYGLYNIKWEIKTIFSLKVFHFIVKASTRFDVLCMFTQKNYFIHMTLRPLVRPDYLETFLIVVTRGHGCVAKRETYFLFSLRRPQKDNGHFYNIDPTLLLLCVSARKSFKREAAAQVRNGSVDLHRRCYQVAIHRRKLQLVNENRLQFQCTASRQKQSVAKSWNSTCVYFCMLNWTIFFWCSTGLPDGLFSNKKFQIWVNFGGLLNGNCWYILWPFGIFYGHLV